MKILRDIIVMRFLVCLTRPLVALFLLLLLLRMLHLVTRGDLNEGGNLLSKGRDLMGVDLPSVSPQDGPPTHLEPSWVAGASVAGFLSVEKVLADPKTTKKPQSKQDASADGKKLKRRKRPRVKNNLAMSKTDKNSPDFKSVMNYNSNFSPHITKELYVPGYSQPHPELCKDKTVKNKTVEVKVTIMIISAPTHTRQRAAIRETWGRQRKVEDGVVVAFIVGLVGNSSEDRLVEQESEEHRDVVISKVPDLYENLSLKTLSAFSWLLSLCPRSEFMLKVDDDMFVQVERLLDLVESLEAGPETKLILGNISRGWKPVRNPESKYFISEAQYSGVQYPDFATGPSYLVSRRAVELMVPRALTSLYIHLEDVFLTGVVAEEVGVERNNVEQFKNNANRVPARFMGCTIQHTITIHKVGPEEQKDLHELARKGAECGKRKIPKQLDKSLKKNLYKWWEQSKSSAV